MARKNGSRGKSGKRQQSKVHREQRAGRPKRSAASPTKKTGGVHGAGMAARPRTAASPRGSEAGARAANDARLAQMNPHPPGAVTPGTPGAIPAGTLPPGVSSAKGTEGA